MNKPELLLPAGSPEALRAAIFGGADAVYMGLPNFSARAKAQNFTLSELSKHIDFAHLFGVKVYIAANTLIKNHETADFFNQIDAAYHAHADAVIVQSAQLGAEIKKRYPGFSLHASTQMGIHSTQGASYAKEMGFSRIILSRETPLSDIKQIKKNIDIELEVFVHGALCVSFSGGCYMSSFISGNSGNRGQCLQPCRLKYLSDEIGGGDYKLSLSDLRLGDSLRQLISAGVDSFKIEGRMRSPEYCYHAAQYYSGILSEKEIEKTQEQALRGTYNRGGFTKGHTFDDINITSDKTPSHIGVLLGVAEKVNAVDIKDINAFADSAKGYGASGGGIFKNAKNQASRHMPSKIKGHSGASGSGVHSRASGAFILKSDKALDIKDGFKLLSADGREKGGAIYRGQKADGGYVLYSSAQPENGDLICLTKDSAVAEGIARLQKKLPAEILLYARPQQVPYIALKSGSANVRISAQLSAETIQGDVSSALSSYLKAVSKLGDSVFCVDEHDITIDTKDAFIPVSVVNDMRRKACMALEGLIIDNFRKENRTYGRSAAHIKDTADTGQSEIGRDFAINSGISPCSSTAGITDVPDLNFTETADTHADGGISPCSIAAGANEPVLSGFTEITDVYADGSAAYTNSVPAAVKGIAAIYDGQLPAEMLIADHVILKPELYSADNVKKLTENIDAGKVFLYLPALMREKDQERIREIIVKAGIGGAYANSLDGAELARDAGIRLFAGTGLNIFNDRDASGYADSAGFCYSKELTLSEISRFSNQGGYVFAYGKILVMTLNHCFYRSLNKAKCGDCPHTPDAQLTDRTGAKFYVSRYRISKCYFELYNGKVLNALSRTINADKLLLNLCGTQNHDAVDIIKSARKSRLLPGGYGFTTGHLYRGVK